MGAVTDDAGAGRAVCPTCGREFGATCPHHKFCRPECRPSYRKRKGSEVVPCGWCRTPFETRKSHRRFCSAACGHKFHARKAAKVFKVGRPHQFLRDDGDESVRDRPVLDRADIYRGLKFHNLMDGRDGWFDDAIRSIEDG